MSSDIGRKFASAAFIVGLFLLWEVLCIAFHVSDVILPRPSQVFVTMWQRAPSRPKPSDLELRPDLLLARQLERRRADGDVPRSEPAGLEDDDVVGRAPAR